MKIYYTFFILLFYGIVSAHEDRIIKQTYANVVLTTTASDDVEEMNKTLIIGQYAAILLQKYSYTEKIYLYFMETQLEAPSVKVWHPEITDNSENTDGINIMFRMFQYNIEGCLKVIEQAIISKINLVDHPQEIYNSMAPSDMVKAVLQVKINRPNDIKALEKNYGFSYYVHNNTYHFIQINDSGFVALGTFENILDFHILQHDLVIVFTARDEFSVIRLASPMVTLQIDMVPKFYRPYKVRLLGDNKIVITFSSFSELKNRVMLYFLDKNVFIQDLDQVLFLD